jgi:hypothetical protein
MNRMLRRVAFMCTFFVLSGSSNSLSEEVPRLAFGLGAGFPQLWFASARVGLGQRLQTGVGFSDFSVGGDHVRIVAGDVQVHLTARQIRRRPSWFINLGSSYMTDENVTRRFEDVFVSTGSGLEFAILRHMGFQLDGGAWIRLSHKKIQKMPPSGWFSDLELNIPVLPYIRFQVFSFW